jgi:hypothetical protein
MAMIKGKTATEKTLTCNLKFVLHFLRNTRYKLLEEWWEDKRDTVLGTC